MFLKIFAHATSNNRPPMKQIPGDCDPLWVESVYVRYSLNRHMETDHAHMTCEQYNIIPIEMGESDQI